MKRLAIAAVGLALVVGIVVGGMVGNPFDGKASASTAAQQREDQIAVVADGAHGIDLVDADWALVPAAAGDLGTLMVALDPADYPANSTFRLETVSLVFGGGGASVSGCVRLFDMTEGAPVSGTEVCHTVPPDQLETALLRSEPVALASGEHVYTLQDKVTPEGGYFVSLASARVIVEWTGSYAVGGIAELPAVAGTGTSGMGSATYAVLAGAAAGVLAFAVLATLSVKRRTR
jgi:hypothetical protein